MDSLPTAAASGLLLPRDVFDVDEEENADTIVNSSESDELTDACDDERSQPCFAEDDERGVPLDRRNLLRDVERPLRTRYVYPVRIHLSTESYDQLGPKLRHALKRAAKSRARSERIGNAPCQALSHTALRALWLQLDECEAAEMARISSRRNAALIPVTSFSIYVAGAVGLPLCLKIR